MDINLVDLTVHIDENLSPEQRITVEDSLRALDGVTSVHGSSKTPHLTIVQYNPEVMDSQKILKRITDQGAHAELIGL
ncbi:MAG: ATP-binding protein [Gammaproteobacteria bacterium]|nr:ATP-binding protein [Gammaproteobacteria bacterium]